MSERIYAVRVPELDGQPSGYVLRSGNVWSLVTDRLAATHFSAREAAVTAIKNAPPQMRFGAIIEGFPRPDMIGPRAVLTELFDVETPYDDPGEAADILLRRLRERGFVVVPMDASGEVIKAWRNSDLRNPRMIYSLMVEAASR